MQGFACHTYKKKRRIQYSKEKMKIFLCYVHNLLAVQLIHLHSYLPIYNSIKSIHNIIHYSTDTQPAKRESTHKMYFIHTKVFITENYKTKCYFNEPAQSQYPPVHCLKLYILACHTHMAL